MKKIIYLLIAILFVSCSSYRANKYWEKEIVNKYDKENISFKVKEYYQATNGYDSLIYYVKKTDQKYFAVDENVRYSILKEDSAKVPRTKKPSQILKISRLKILMVQSIRYYLLIIKEDIRKIIQRENGFQISAKFSYL